MVADGIQAPALGAALTRGRVCSPGGNGSVMQACGNTVHLTCGLKRIKKGKNREGANFGCEILRGGFP